MQTRESRREGIDMQGYYEILTKATSLSIGAALLCALTILVFPF